MTSKEDDKSRKSKDTKKQKKDEIAEEKKEESKATSSKADSNQKGEGDVHRRVFHEEGHKDR